MAIQYLTIIGNSITELVNSTNTLLAGLLDRTFKRIEFEVADDVRYRGREFRLVITVEDGATPVAAQFIVTGFETVTFDQLTAAMQAYAAGIPLAFVSPAWTAIIDTNGRSTHRASGLLFSCTDAVQAGKNFQAGGGGGAGATDHSLLINRDLINQHPAKAISQDKLVALAVGPTAADVVTAAARTAISWDVSLDNGADTFRTSTLRAQENSGSVVMQEFGVTVDGVAALPTMDVTYAAGAFTLTITTPGIGWNARIRRNSLF